ncbi:hypothetical protein C7M84_014111 [Penaeus vannamei]|uniref:Uncharacterized protein n=1 Tax=Penaeus vannamei TaxID=6689 RepID=A0A423SU68_PENVA|nr:hypothetical protein C7M84_014111 [Penaeus vannamei]
MEGEKGSKIVSQQLLKGNRGMYYTESDCSAISTRCVILLRCSLGQFRCMPLGTFSSIIIIFTPRRYDTIEPANGTYIPSAHSAHGHSHEPRSLHITSVQQNQHSSPLQTVTTTTVTPYHVSHTPSRHAATTPRTTTRRTTKRTDYQTGTDTQHDTSHQNATHHERTVYHDDYSDHTTGHAYSYTTIYRPRHTSTTSHDYTAPHHRATTSDHRHDTQTPTGQTHYANCHSRHRTTSTHDYTRTNPPYDTDLWSRDHNPPRLRSSPHLHDYTVTTSTDYHRQTTTSATTTDDYLRAQRHIHDHDYGTVTLTPPTLPPRLYHCYDLPPRLASSATTTVTDHHHVSLPPDDTPCHHHRSDYPTVHTTLARNSAQCTYQANDY